MSVPSWLGFPRWIFIIAGCLTALPVAADQVEMLNGDRYSGQVLLVNTNVLILQSENVGRISLPRAKVAVLRLGDVTASVSPTPAPKISRPAQASTLGAVTNSDLSAAFRGLGGSETSNLVSQVRSQLLGDAGPEASQKFDDLLGGLMSGRMNMDDLRQQAKAAADQLRDLKGQSGNEDPTGSLDGYLAILDSFLKETAPTSTATNSVASRAPSTVRPAAGN
jgi:hypothetical protein